MKALTVGQKVWMQSGPLRKEVTVTEIAKRHFDVELVGDGGKRVFLTFRINGKPGTIFEKLNNKQSFAGLDCWQEEAGTEFGPWELVDSIR